MDRILRSFLGEVPLSVIYRALRTRRILVNGNSAEGGYRIVEGDILSFDPVLGAQPFSAPPGTPEPARALESKALDALGDLLLLATADLLFLNKPWGMLVHGPDSLEVLVRAALSERSEASLSFSPGPLHRLDRNTSGLVTFPRSAAGARAFTALLRARRLEKRYLALVEGELDVEEEWTDKLERDCQSQISAVGDTGREARSLALPLAVRGGYSLILVELQTGLTHQIRAQAASHLHPLAGDAKYGGKPFKDGYILHALSLRFPEPPFPDLPERIVAPLPPSALSRLGRIFGAELIEKSIETTNKV